MTEQEIKTIIDKTCKKFYPNLSAGNNELTGEQIQTVENLLRAERLYESADILIAYRRYIDFHGLADVDELMGSLRKQRAENGSVILELRQELGLDTSMFDNEELGLDE